MLSAPGFGLPSSCFSFLLTTDLLSLHGCGPFRCTGCEAVLCGIEEQVSRANQYRESQLKVKIQVETEVSHFFFFYFHILSSEKSSVILFAFLLLFFFFYLSIDIDPEMLRTH